MHMDEKSVYKHKKQKLTTAKQEHRTRSQWHLNLRFNCSRWAKLPRNLPNYRWNVTPRKGNGEFASIVDPTVAIF